MEPPSMVDVDTDMFAVARIRDVVQAKHSLVHKPNILGIVYLDGSPITTLPANGKSRQPHWDTGIQVSAFVRIELPSPLIDTASSTLQESTKLTIAFFDLRLGTGKCDELSLLGEARLDAKPLFHQAFKDKPSSLLSRTAWGHSRKTDSHPEKAPIAHALGECQRIAKLSN
jgi:hypothetical protein